MVVLASRGGAGLLDLADITAVAGAVVAVLSTTPVEGGPRNDPCPYQQVGLYQQDHLYVLLNGPRMRARTT